MSLPSLWPLPCRRLVQGVWDLANGNLRWPTFAELDRRLDHRYELQAEDVLKEMPPGFLYGYGPNSPVPPHDSQDIALTVAGVAACHNTKEILSIFLQLTQIAVFTEKGWEPPPGAPEGAAALTTAEFAAQASHLPAAGRPHLMQLVFLMLKAEPSWGWTGLSGPDADGQWTITIDRRIRAFRGVQTIDDYWSRRFKPWETQRPIPTGTLPIRTGLPGGVREPATVSVNDNSGAPVSVEKPAGHAFISYVREDSHHVDRLQRDLEDAGIAVWRDTADLWPGEDWRMKIRRAITDNALVFIACFSSQSTARTKSYQNEELALAIDQLRQRRPDIPWLIPVRFDDCRVPDLDLGGGRTLTSIQRADLFGDRREADSKRLLAIIQRLLGQPPSHQATALPAFKANQAPTGPPQRTGGPAPASAGPQASYDRPAQSPGVNPIGSIIHAPGRATVEGLVQVVEIRPVERGSALAVEISDSTGDLTALFYGRGHMPGIICGAKVRLRGPFSIREDGPIMINPAYELLSTDEESPSPREARKSPRNALKTLFPQHPKF
jgi:TIR domain-containing protein